MEVDEGIEYCKESLVLPVIDNDGNSTKSVKCVLCATKFVRYIKDSVQRHYRRRHKINFKKNRNCRPSSPVQPSKIIEVVSRFKDANHFLSQCVTLTAELNLPFAAWDNSVFRNFIMPLEEMYKVEASARTVRELGIKHVKSVSTDGQLFALKMSIASRVGKSYLALTIQVIRDWKVVVRSLGMVPLEGALTAQYLQEKTMVRIVEFGLSVDQVSTVTTTNDANVMLASLEIANMSIGGREITEDVPSSMATAKTMSTLGGLQLTRPVSDKRVRCAAHTVQLAVNAYLVECVPSIRRNLNDWIPPLELTKPRWSSIYEMLKGLLRLRGNADEMGIQWNWNYAEDLLEALQPVADLSNKMEAVQYLIGDAFVDIARCEAALYRIRRTNEHARRLLENIGTQKAELYKSGAVLAGLYLDPRFNNAQRSSILTESAREVAISHIKTVKTQHDLLNPVTQPLPQSPSRSSALPLGPEEMDIDNEDDYFLACAGFGNRANPTTGNYENRLRNLNSTITGVPLSYNVLEFWKILQLSDPELAEVAEIVLASPACLPSIGGA